MARKRTDASGRPPTGTGTRSNSLSEIEDFFQAVEAGDVDRAGTLLRAHPELAHARDADGATALHHAAFNGHRALVEILIDAGADLNARDGTYGATPSGWAIHYLRELGGLLAIEIEDVLHAIRTGDVAWVRRLVTRHPALLDATDAHGKSLAEHARESGDVAIADVFASRVGRDA